MCHIMPRVDQTLRGTVAIFNIPFAVYCLSIVSLLALGSYCLALLPPQPREQRPFSCFRQERCCARARMLQVPTTHYIASARLPSSLFHSSSSTVMPPLLHRHSLPDVPEDIEDDFLLHLNDPNYDLHSDSSSTIVASDPPSAYKPSQKYEDGWTSVSTISPQGDADFQLRLDETQAKSEGTFERVPPME